MMPDTNQVNQVLADGHQVVNAVQVNWTAICIVGAAVLHGTVKVNGWLEYVASKVIAHGGVIWILKKLIYNPAADDVKR